MTFVIDMLGDKAVVGTKAERIMEKLLRDLNAEEATETCRAAVVTRAELQILAIFRTSGNELQVVHVGKHENGK